MFNRTGRYVFAAALSLSFGSAAVAGPGYRMVWNVDDDIPLVSKTNLKAGDEILRLRLLPPALLRATDDIRGARGELLIVRGTQLVRTKSTANIACTFSAQKKSGIEQALLVWSLKRICLVDQDGDGRYDAFFVRATNKPAFFLLRGRLDDRMEPMPAIALESIDPTLVEGAPRISLKLSRGSRPDRNTTIEGDVGNDTDPFPLAATLKVKAADLPASFQIYGGTLRIAPAADGRYTVEAEGRFHAPEMDFWD